jgi:two-component system sensor histidine kinase KdpD
LRQTRRFEALGAVAAAAAIGMVTAFLFAGVRITSPTIPALGFLLVVLVVAAAAPLRVAIAASVLAVACLNYFFMPPVGAFSIADPQNWVALFTFLVVSVIASNLSTAARDRARDAIARRDELTRLFDLSRDVLLTTDSREAITHLPRFIARRFDLAFVAICLPRSSDWEIFEAGVLGGPLDHNQLSVAFAAADRLVEFDARERTYAGHRIMPVADTEVRVVPLRLGTKAVGLLASAGRAVEPGTLDALAGLAAIAIERAQFLEERKTAELARQSEELKSALLASLGHDLRTPLTAIRVAASNLQASWLADGDRRDQSEVILAEVERLDRLFQNILEMARIDAGAIAAEARWVHPSEIVEAARDQVEHALRDHRLAVDVESDVLVRVDPRLTAAALARLIENATQYAPAGSVISVSASVTPEGLRATVSDRGPGIAPLDLPRIFERFYRGGPAGARRSGTGMGLSIARGMLAAERGRIWAANRPDGGAQFTIVVPAESKPALVQEQTS